MNVKIVESKTMFNDVLTIRIQRIRFLKQKRYEKNRFHGNIWKYNDIILRVGKL